jgi:hypothetical protein
VEEWLCLITVEIQLQLSELRVFLLFFLVFKVCLSLLNCKFFYTVEIQLQFSELPVFLLLFLVFKVCLSLLNCKFFYTVEIQLQFSELPVFLLLLLVFKVCLSLLNCKFFYNVEIQLQFSELPVFFSLFCRVFWWVFHRWDDALGPPKKHTKTHQNTHEISLISRLFWRMMLYLVFAGSK